MCVHIICILTRMCNNAYRNAKTEGQSIRPQCADEKGPGIYISSMLGAVDGAPNTSRSMHAPCSYSAGTTRFLVGHASFHELLVQWKL